MRAAVLVLGFALMGCTSPIPSASTSAIGSRHSTASATPTNGEASHLGAVSPSLAPPSVAVASDTNVPPVVASLAPAPGDCSPAGPPDTMTLKDFGGGFSDGTVLGRAPVWTLGLPGDGILHLAAASGTGERFPSAKVMWIVGPHETQPVAVSGRERTTGDPLWFQVYPSNSAPSLPSSYTTTLTLAPAAPNRGYAENSIGAWSIWGIGIGARAAGCYSMTVVSSTGSWKTELAIGS